MHLGDQEIQRCGIYVIIWARLSAFLPFACPKGNRIKLKSVVIEFRKQFQQLCFVCTYKTWT